MNYIKKIMSEYIERNYVILTTNEAEEINIAFDKLVGENYQLSSSSEAKEKQLEYYKARCEAAEAVLFHGEPNVVEPFYSKWQQLKNQTP